MTSNDVLKFQQSYTVANPGGGGGAQQVRKSIDPPSPFKKKAANVLACRFGLKILRQPKQKRGWGHQLMLLLFLFPFVSISSFFSLAFCSVLLLFISRSPHLLFLFFPSSSPYPLLFVTCQYNVVNNTKSNTFGKSSENMIYLLKKMSSKDQGLCSKLWTSCFNL